jgi:hypothetical protein
LWDSKLIGIEGPAIVQGLEHGKLQSIHTHHASILFSGISTWFVGVGSG